ncbi:aromatic acid exporter family protein [Anaerocolumna sp.]|uniref:aromatic acid exporter family protein n=1 Tax=Anaerocolumna sp. TaxID=2041569 RepID=UPI0028ACC6C3|nr:aromatic acid exporter family protein [Anaerocolumna sp.]
MKQFNKVSKIAVGSTLAILLASSIGLDYSISAGIITLLTIQDTKKETIFISIKRIIAFLFATILALILFLSFGFGTIPFGVFLFLFVGGCSIVKLQDGIAMNSVLATHYILSKSISIHMIANEALLLFIGAGIGTLINLFMSSNVKQIREVQERIESDLRKILFRMAYFLRESDKSTYKDHCFVPLQEDINLGITYAYTNMNNTLFQESEYFIRYMEMRKHQLQILKEIYEKIISLHTVPKEVLPIAQFIESIANSLAESNNAKGLLELEHNLEEEYRQSSLPLSRVEFEDRAVLYMILKDFKMFLLIKEEFADTLTKDQIQKYWS